MATVETIEEQIAELDNASFSKLRDWFLEFDQSRWDKQIEVDSNAGKLDFLINAALDEHRAGKTRDL
ncbi:hypothetical protein [Candidatus Nitrotoga sp. 1052]|uniref:hypothetical protein n=1 Tax=Candidatus Nitrotoga sp. 1052 TaxID=2886964 RepID=UPI001EF72102|nr:hypothetical protein [Candidatus Nitrotoga sp. 1052]CAH1091425.1 conserved hypothetical protein [Candidatus Nitrotoga sp. 1052]